MKARSIFLCHNVQAFLLIFLVAVCITGCVGNGSAKGTTITPPVVADCPVTKAIWLKPLADVTVSGTPVPDYYYANEDQSILVSAWWTGKEEYPLRATKEGTKMGWFRPQGADLTITGRRIDAPAPPLKAEVPCCYTGQFQATGLIFSTPGCWEITGQSAGRSLTFVVWVEP